MDRQFRRATGQPRSHPLTNCPLLYFSISVTFAPVMLGRALFLTPFRPTEPEDCYGFLQHVRRTDR